jgi:hypothetical protein
MGAASAVCARMRQSCPHSQSVAKSSGISCAVDVFIDIHYMYPAIGTQRAYGPQKQGKRKPAEIF